MKCIHLDLALAAILAATATQANNVQLSAPTLTGTNGPEGYTLVQFDASWENSWRTSTAPGNWDAAWIFVKYKDANTGEWHHARLHSNAGHKAGSGAAIATGLLDPGSAFDATSNWGVGVFLYRSANGYGTFSPNDVQLRWNYAENGISYSDIASVKVFALEMVYVPQGGFSVGTGGSETFGFKNGNTTNPFAIGSEAALPMGNVNGQLWANGAIESAMLPTAFPKGFAGFYLMKHGIAQQNYKDFLNTLTRTQQNNRTGTNLAVGVTNVTNRFVMSNTSIMNWRNGIRCNATIDANDPIVFYCDGNGNGTGDEAGDGQWIACNFLSWADVAAYLDWSGLRPMTELEYEKACRGPVAPLTNEYAWGTFLIRNGNYSGTQMSEIAEAVSDPETGMFGNGLYSNAGLTPNGPGRVGLFGGTTTTRAQIGASYYGALELSGNLWERPVTVGNAQGRAFTGTTGNGSLDGAGNADAANWPGTNAIGIGFRGGSWVSSASTAQVSSRSLAASPGSDRINAIGGRGLRVKP